MIIRSRRRSLSRLLAVAAAGLLLTACSVQDLIEGGLSRVEGVGEVTIDFSEEGGTFSITSEEGEVIGFDVDSEGQANLTTPDGTMETSIGGEVPEEVHDGIDLPSGYEPHAVTRFEAEDEGSGILVQGTIQGEFSSILDELEASLDARWAQTERILMQEGHMGMVAGTDADEERGVHATLVMDQGDEGNEGMLQIMVILEP